MHIKNWIKKTRSRSRSRSGSHRGINLMSASSSGRGEEWKKLDSTYVWEIQLCGRRRRRRDLGGVVNGGAGKEGAAGCGMGRRRCRSSRLSGCDMVERPASLAALVGAATARGGPGRRSLRQEVETRVGASVSENPQPAVVTRRVSGGSIGLKHPNPSLPNGPEVFSSGFKLGRVRHSETQKSTPAEQGLRGMPLVIPKQFLFPSSGYRCVLDPMVYLMLQL
jgi:hypothetical protein